jgi:hypothetical protein
MMKEGLQGTIIGGGAMMIVEDLTLILIVVGMKTVAATIENVMTRMIATMIGPPDMQMEMRDIGKRLVPLERRRQQDRKASWEFFFLRAETNL